MLLERLESNIDRFTLAARALNTSHFVEASLEFRASLTIKSAAGALDSRRFYRRVVLRMPVVASNEILNTPNHIISWHFRLI